MNRRHLTRGISALIIALMGLPLAWAQPVGEVQQASSEALAASAEIAFQAAGDDFLLAQGNMGEMEDPTLWVQILASRDLMTAARASEEWLIVIDQSQRIGTDVQTLLQRLAGQAEASLVQMRADMQAFEMLGAETHAPSLVEESRSCLHDVESLINQRQYRLAIATANVGLERIEQTVVGSKRSLANQGISEIEDLIAQIVNAGGDSRMTERYRALTEGFEDLLTHFYNCEFDEVLPGIEELRPVAEQMLSDLQSEQP
ncbi:hypothetical protein JXA47_04390 [Candidatus Sumerlaeota bacterium]|nr:hypothetical protein [Candidatus Sumerlaeota bacterium]